MIYSLPHKKFGMLATVALIGIILVSCGSYQQASYYNDGIYTNGNPQVTEGNYSRSQPQEQSNTYGDYFGEKANQYQDILDNEIFTDVDSYYGGSDQDSIAPAPQGNYFTSNNDYNAYAGWGDNPTSVNINVYNGGYGGFGYGYYDPWVWGYGGGYWGYYNPWYRPWYGGYWGAGYWGIGHYPGWAWGGGWYGSYYPYYYSNYGYYGNRHYGYTMGRRGYYNNNYLAANTVRRSSGTVLNNRADNARYRSSSNSNSTVRRSSDYRSGTTARRTVGVDAAQQNRSYRTSRSTRTVPSYSTSKGNQQTTISRRNTNSNPNVNSTRNTYRSRSTAPSQSSRSSTVAPPTRSSQSPSVRSSGGTYRSSGSSGAVRSSSGSSGGSRRH